MNVPLPAETVTVVIGWQEVCHYSKNVQMTREEFDAWQKRLGSPLDHNGIADLFDRYQLQSVEANDWDGVDDLDSFGIDE